MDLVVAALIYYIVGLLSVIHLKNIDEAACSGSPWGCGPIGETFCAMIIALFGPITFLVTCYAEWDRDKH